MITKSALLVLCIFIRCSTGSRMKCDPGYNEPVFRTGPHLFTDPLFRREAIFQSEPYASSADIYRSGAVYGHESVPSKQGFPPTEQYVPNQHVLATAIPEQQMIPQPLSNAPIIHTDHIIRGEPTIIRSEPNFRREPVFRSQPVVRRGQIYHNAPIIAEPPVFENDATYTIMVPCPCSQQQHQHQQQQPPSPNVQNYVPVPPTDTFYQFSQQLVPQHFLPQRITYQKPFLKQQVIQPVFTIPRVQRVLRKSYRPQVEKIQYPPMPLPAQSAPEFNVNNNFQNQAPSPENTSEPAPAPVTSRTPSQSPPNPFTLAQVSSIC